MKSGGGDEALARGNRAQAQALTPASHFILVAAPPSQYTLSKPATGVSFLAPGGRPCGFTPSSIHSSAAYALSGVFRFVPAAVRSHQE